MSRKSPSNISAPSACSWSERWSILATNVRTGIPALSSISDPCRPVLPCLPPAAEVTRTGFAMAMGSFTFCSGLVPCGTGCLRTYGTVWYRVKGNMMATRSTSKVRGEAADETPARERILDAAFSAFMESGFAEASTLEIPTRARVSKRELYALVGSKQEMLVACIRERAKRLQMPAELPEPHDREALARTLETFGTQLLREVTDPTVVAVFR